MKITILTLFPEMFVGPFDESILKRAKEKGLLDITIVNIRDFGIGNHKMVDDKPYGGGVGMVMKVDVLDSAISAVKDSSLNKNEQQVVLLDARGQTFHQTIAQEFSQLKHLILICGHYEGVDERVRSLVDATISVGDFILTGGEIPAMLITDSVARLITGVLKEDATNFESFSLGSVIPTFTLNQTEGKAGIQEIDPASESRMILLEYPQYTLPQEYKGQKVPEVLLSGDHKKIIEWKREQAKKITQLHRPDLLEE